MRSVKVPDWAVRNAIGALANSGHNWTDTIAALQKALAPKKFVRLAAKRTRAKKRTQGEQTAEIRAAVFERSRGLCDYCQQATPTDLEHPFGRVRVKQSAETCLAVCRPCHRARTNLVGGATRWWKKIHAAFRLHGLWYSAESANRMVMFHASKDALLGRASQTSGGAEQKNLASDTEHGCPQTQGRGK